MGGVFNSLIFFTYENTIDFLERQPYFASSEYYRKNGDSSYLNIGLGALVAGSLSPLMSTPQELIKNLAQMNLQNKGHIHEEWIILKQLVQKGILGNQGIYRGFGLTFPRDFISFYVYFMSYEYLYRKLGK